MSSYQNDLKEMIFGDDPDCQNVDFGYLVKQFREFLEPDMFPDLMEDEQQSDEQLEAILDEEEEEIQPIKFQIYEPNTELEIPVDIPQQLFLQQNAGLRTLLKEIGLKTGSMMAGSISSTRQAASSKQFPIYKFTDLYYAASDRVKNIYERVQSEMLYKNRREKKFDQDYYDQLLSSFQVFNEQQLKEYLQKESESIQESLKSKKTQKEIEAQLNKYTKQSNESKDNFFILSQETINYNPYDQLDYNPHINEQFFQELAHIINREQEVTTYQSDRYSQSNPFKQNLKKVKLNEENSKSQQELGQNKQMEIEAEIRKSDKFETCSFFSNQYELFENQNRKMEQENQQLSTNLDSYLYQAPKFKSTFKFWGEPEEPGKNLQIQIARQLETDKKQNEQGQDQKFIEIDVEKPFLKQKDDVEFQKAIDDYSYYNKEIVEFCQGKKDNFLEKPYETYNRVDISLNQGNFFSERLEFLLHQKKIKEQPIITNNLSKIAAPSVISKQIENKSLPSKNQVSRDDSQEQEGFDSDSNLNNNNFPQLMQLEEGPNKELQEQIMLQMKNQQQNQSTTTTVYYNSVVAENFTLNNFSQDIEQHSQYHRSDLVDLLYLDKYLNLGLSREQVNYFDPWNVKMIPTKKFQDQTNTETKFDEFPEKIKSQEYYKHLFQLSLAKGNFILFEYVEQRPLILNNTGMCIKASRYVYPNRALQQFKQIQSQQEDQQLIEFKKFLANKLGQIGIVKFIDREKQQGIPLQGQLNDEQHIGIAIIENDLYRAPIFRQKLPETDFVLVRQKQDDLHYQYALRPVDYIYLVGQIEPKVEIYTPHSRPLGTFLKSCLKTYIKKVFKEGQQIKQDELEKLFPKQSPHNVRSALRECQGVTDQQNQKTWSFQGDRSVLKFDVQPIQVCQHESMLHSCYLLNEFGLQTLRNSDKMKKTLQEFLTRHPKDYEDWVIARCIEHELNMTAWSLSTSFLNSALHQGRMLLYGLGDPTSGHGGLSYIKKALKARGEKGTNAVQEKKQSVMGTDNDLRKLHVSDIKRILLQLGKSEEQVRNLKRWKMINLCTKHIQEVLNPDNQNSQLAISYYKNLETLSDKERKYLDVIEKYSKNLRLTTKKQKEQYQKELDSHLNCLIYNLTLTVKSNYFEDFREITNLRQKRKFQKDDKNKDLEYSQQEIEEYLVPYKDRYKIDFKLYLLKDKEIWLSKKKKKGLI